MANKIQLRRGLKSDLPTLASGEPGYITDTRELYIGTGGGNVNMGGSHWYIGTSMSGTNSAANTYSYSGCPDVKFDDIYLNTSNGNIYTCTTAGSGINAKWTYRGNIKGAKGDTGATGAKGDDGESAIVDSELSATSVNPVQNKVITEALDLKADSSDFYKHGYAGAGEVVDSVHELITEKLAPPTTIVIACTASNHKEFANYICGNGDSTAVFQNAIDSLPLNGGKISILEGTYNISGNLICSKDVIFEGTGKGTVINFNSSSYIGNYINGQGKSIHFDKCNINIISHIRSDDYSGTNFIGYMKNVTMSYCDLSFTLADFGKCAQVFRSCSNVNISHCNISLINNGNTANSCDFSSRINLIYDESGNGNTNELTTAVISDSIINCTGKLSSNGQKAIACVAWAYDVGILNCIINLNNYSSITQNIDLTDGGGIRCINGCSIYDKSNVDVEIGCEIFSNNSYYKTNSHTVYFPVGAKIIGNIFDNNADNDIKIYNNGSVIFIGNSLNHRCTLTTSSNAKIIGNFN